MKRRGESEDHLAAWSCACCTKCWIITKGKLKGTCIYGGPFEGYEVTHRQPHPEISTDLAGGLDCDSRVEEI